MRVLCVPLLRQQHRVYFLLVIFMTQISIKLNQLRMLAFKVCHFLTNETESKPAGVWKQYRAWGTSLPGWGATLTA